MKTKKPKKFEPRVTQSQLAEKLGVSRQLIAWHIKNGKPPPMEDFDGWMEHLAVNGRDGSLPPALRKKIAEQRLRLVRAQAERAELENSARADELTPWVKVDAFIRWVTGTLFFGELERMAYEFPAVLKGKSEIEIKREVESQIEKARKSIATQADLWLRKKGK